MPLSAGPNQPPALLFRAFGPLAFFPKYSQTNISTFIRLLCIRFCGLASTPSPYWAVSSLAL